MIVPNLKQRLIHLRDALLCGFIERDMAVRLALLSLLSGEHLLLIGAPGTAKSELARRLHRVVKNGDYFERLLTKFSVPEELFGPLSIKALEEDRYHRLTHRYLPSATVAFIDEIFKANSAILNSLLTLLNEREFDNGDTRVEVPLLCVIGASNELPEEVELQALYDRFICRYEVKPVSDRSFTRLLTLNESDRKPVDPEEKLDLNQLQSILCESTAVQLPEDVIKLLQALRTYLHQQALYISDRRWRKVVKLLKVAAYTNGQSEVSLWDCYLLQYLLWEKPQQRKMIAQWYQSHLGMGSGFNQERLEKLVITWETTLNKEKNSRTQLKNQLGEYLYVGQDGQQTTLKEAENLADREGEPLFLAPPDNEDRSNNDQGYTMVELQENFFDDYYKQCHINGHWQHIDQYVKQRGNRLIRYVSNKPLTEPTLYTQTFIDKRVDETSQIRRDLQGLADALEQQIASIGRELSEHLWITADFIQQAEQSLVQTQEAAQSLLQRMQVVIEGFKTLPLQ